MISYNQWKQQAKASIGKYHQIDKEIFLFKSSNILRMEVGPFLADTIIAIILDKGNLQVTLNMDDYEAQAPCMITIQPNQTYKITNPSNDLEGSAIIMSESFSNSLFNEYADFNAMRKTIAANPIANLNESMKKAFDTYLKLLENLGHSPINAFRIKAAKHLTLSMFYGIAFTMYDLNEIKPTDRQTILFKQFEKELKQHYKKEREVRFYADRLCISPKYLSAIAQEQTGKSALKCINAYVANECQALLLSTDLTLQQISDRLNFPSQSIFSKFFKRMTGVSPREYRKQIL